MRTYHENLSHESQTRARSKGCKAGRTSRYGVSYAPKLSCNLHLVTKEKLNQEEREGESEEEKEEEEEGGQKNIIFFLKSFCRIFTNSVCALEPSESLDKLQHLEPLLKNHLLLQASNFDRGTVEFMNSWGEAPMLGHWNLYAKELQLYLPNPAEFISIPIATINKIRGVLRWRRPEANVVLESLWDSSIQAAALSSSAKLAPQPPKDENPFWDGTPALQPESETIFLYYDEEGEIRSRTLGDDEELVGEHDVFLIPLVDDEWDEVAVAIGRTSENISVQFPAKRRVNTDRCKAIHTFKYGLSYAPRLSCKLNIKTLEESIIRLLKPWTRVCTNGIDAIEPTDCINKLEHVEPELKAHLLQQSPKFPASTVKYMKSWGETPMKQHWNLFAREFQVYLPDPAQIFSVPVTTVNEVITLLEGDENAVELLADLTGAKDKASSLLQRARVRPQPSHEENPFWGKGNKITSSEMDDAIESVRTKERGLHEAAAFYNVDYETLRRRTKETGIVSKFEQGGQKLPISLEMATAIQSVRDSRNSERQAAAEYGVPRSTLKSRLSDEGIISAFKKY
ncbi:uncharacterized protein LOC118435191 [Folsomia candida]|nr:uncharacterized protein LOC118435191 [Folsomia candida]